MTHQVEKSSCQGHKDKLVGLYPSSILHLFSLKHFTKYLLCARHWAYNRQEEKRERERRKDEKEGGKKKDVLYIMRDSDVNQTVALSSAVKR